MMKTFMTMMKTRILIYSGLFFLVGCGSTTIVTHNADCLNVSKVDVPYLSGFGTSADPNQFGYVWSDEKDKIYMIDNGVLGKNLKSRFPFAKIYLSDSYYALVDHFWFHEIFAPNIKKKFPKYSKTFDCDNFSGSVVFFAQWLHNYTQCFNCDSVAVGELYYSMEGDLENGHAINIILYQKDGKYLYEFYDVNKSSKVVLDKKEINSIFYIRF